MSRIKSVALEPGDAVATRDVMCGEYPGDARVASSREPAPKYVPEPPVSLRRNGTNNRRPPETMDMDDDFWVMHQSTS